MAKFNTDTTARASVQSPVRSTGQKETNAQGGTGYLRTAQSELYLLAVSNLVGEDTFYEKANERDDRFRDLIRTVINEGGAGWIARFVPYLRSTLNMRSAPVVMAAEYALALKGSGRVLPPEHSVRWVIDSALQRPDELGEFISYWKMRTGRATLPGGVQRGVADAAQRMLTERSALRYDGQDRAVRLGDVVEIAHPQARAPWQGALYQYLLDRRHNPSDIRADLALLPMIQANRDFHSISPQVRRSALAEFTAADLENAGISWEALSGWLGGPLDAAFWEKIAPSMGYMALLRNLRNFDEAGLSDSSAHAIGELLADPERVATSKQFPFRFLSAYRAAPSLRWAWPLEQALNHSLRNVPSLPGKTLILVDTSGSMNAPFSKDGKVMRWDQATIYGMALARTCQSSSLVSFSAGGYGRSSYGYQMVNGFWRMVATEPVDDGGSKEFPLDRGESLLKSLERWKTGGYFIGGGTDTPGAVRKHYTDQSRVIIVTDEQNGFGGDPASLVPSDVPVYTFNLAGYRHGQGLSGTGNRHVFGGLSDAAFKMIPLLEQGRSQDWPF